MFRLEGGCHAWRIPVIERTHAKISIPEALKYVFLGLEAVKMAPEFWVKMDQN